MRRHKWFRALLMTLPLTFAVTSVSAATLDYKTVVENLQKEEKEPELGNYRDGKRSGGNLVKYKDRVYASAAEVEIRNFPNEDAKVLEILKFGENTKRVALCDNGWSKVVAHVNGKAVYGYAKSYYLSNEELFTEVDEQLSVKADADVLDVPGVRNGVKIGNVKTGDLVDCTGIVSGEWSRITYEADGEEITGFVENTNLSPLETAQAEPQGEAMLTPSKASSDSLWAKASEQNEQEITEGKGVIIGNAVAVDGDAKLVSLGEFRITHYCQCSICCGPWTDGITSTGVIAQTNHTIAVQPGQIPYGSKVVINGQVYVAEDCGGAIVDNCIDVYVASHEEAYAKGVFYTEVFLLVE